MMLNCLGGCRMERPQRVSHMTKVEKEALLLLSNLLVKTARRGNPKKKPAVQSAPLDSLPLIQKVFDRSACLVPCSLSTLDFC